MLKSDYIGKICPYCKTELNDHDEIVVCSVCDMPHHKDCWIENQGCTTFGCMGTIKGIDNDPNTSITTDNQSQEPEHRAFVYCSKCGAPNHYGKSFCGKCGAVMTLAPIVNSDVLDNGISIISSNVNKQQITSSADISYQADSHINANGYSTESLYDQDLFGIVGNNATYYAVKFNQMRSQNKSSSWNWCAFLFTPYWMIYRKMYGPGLGVLAGMLVINYIGGWLISLFALVGYIVFGVLGNSIYMKNVDLLVAQAKGLSEPYKSQFIGKKGGTSIAAAILSAVGYAFLVTLISYL